MQSQPLITETVRTHERNQLVDVTRKVAALVERSKIRQGMVVVYVPHTTAGVTINENADPDVKHDVLAKLQELIPHQQTYYQHAEGNSDSHLKASLVGSSATVLIEGGKLLLGRWQGIYFCEFDGPRQREMHVKLVAWTESSG